jgi:FHS family glucose/mannose:H+ symporter-like MFS transporter
MRTIPAKTVSPPALLSRIIIYLGFAATGVGLALPGSVLPALLAHWALDDSQAGLLFFVGWISCSLGALLVRPSRVQSVACGSVAIACGAFGMAFGSKPGCFVWMAIFGLGLGLTMTSISLLQATKNAHRRGMELNRLNLTWAIGACLCPSLAEHSLRVAGVRVIFSAVGLFFALFSLWMMAFEAGSESSHMQAGPTLNQAQNKRLGLRNLALWPLSMLAVICLPTGIESSMGAWIATYVQRADHTLFTTVTAGSCFWAGLLASRSLSAFIPMPKRWERLVLGQSLATVLLGTVLLIAVDSRVGILPRVFLIGFGLGPIYPMLLSIALQYSENSTIFFVAGLGSAILPWLTGIVSSSTSSLRNGLLVPCAASALMLFLGFRLLIRRAT